MQKQKKEEEKTEVFTTHDIAKIIGMSPATIYRWVKNGEIKHFLTIGNHVRVLKSDLLLFLASKNMPIPESLCVRRTSR